MGWISESNKIGKYKTTYKGFRFYCTKESEVIESVVERDDGMYNKTEFIKGEYIAIDKSGQRIEGYYWYIITKIDIIDLQRIFDKRS